MIIAYPVRPQDITRSGQKGNRQVDRSCDVVIVESNPLFREGLARIIANKKFRIAGKLASVDNHAAGSLPRKCPLLVVLGYRDERGVTAQEIKTIRQARPEGCSLPFVEHERAKTELKGLMPEDAKEAFGRGVRAKRSKSRAISFELLELEEGHASIQ